VYAYQGGAGLHVHFQTAKKRDQQHQPDEESTYNWPSSQDSLKSMGVREGVGNIRAEALARREVLMLS
jgi:hypothetical protein